MKRKQKLYSVDATIGNRGTISRIILADNRYQAASRMWIDHCKLETAKLVVRILGTKRVLWRTEHKKSF